MCAAAQNRPKSLKTPMALEVFESWGASSGRGHGERVEREPITGV